MPMRLVCLLLLAACSSDRASAPPEPARDTWPTALECVATHANPALSEDGARAADALGAALDAAGIHWVSAGSAGYSVNVDVLDAPRARALIRPLIEEQGLAAQVYDPPR